MLNAKWYVGIDWASEAHEVCILDRAGRVHERRQVKHTATALEAFVDRLIELAGGDPSSVAIGRPVASHRPSPIAPGLNEPGA